MPRMTKREREAEELLMRYSKAQQEAKYATKEFERIKALVEALDPGTYGGWERAYGEPREMLDQPAVRELCARHNLVVPLKDSKPPLVVREVR